MTPRKRLSTAIRQAATSSVMYQRAQDELHRAFDDVYGFDLDLDELNEDLVDPLVYGMGPTPSLTDFDKLVAEMKRKATNDT